MTKTNLFRFHLVVVGENSADAHVAGSVHQVECLVDVSDGHAVRNVLVKPELALQVFLDEFGHLSASLDASEGRSGPHATSHQLEGCSLDKRSCGSHTDDDGLAPSLVANLNGNAHQIGVSNALESTIYERKESKSEGQKSIERIRE